MICPDERLDLTSHFLPPRYRWDACLGTFHVWQYAGLPIEQRRGIASSWPAIVGASGEA